MLDYAALPDEEIENRAALDEPGALYEKGDRLLNKGELACARKYLTLSSILGNRDAHMRLGRICEDEDNIEEAYNLYALAWGKGLDNALPRLARMLMHSDKRLGIDILKTHAHEGNADCVRELIDIFKKETSAAAKKELALYKSLLRDLTGKDEDADKPQPQDGTDEAK
ncbi:MAG: hypothetical protein FWH03_01125 [Firmicutes bacterium]|nr:hypothetical protein [Bacillota bacterium]